MKNEITQELVKELFEYRDGSLYWKKIIGKHTRIGEKAGTLVNKKYQYFQIRINKTSYRAHVIIFLYHYGFIPKAIYHNNGNAFDNRIENLSAKDTSTDEITQTYLRTNFSYNDGHLVRLSRRTASSLNIRTKYAQIRVKNEQYATHRLIFLYHHGYLPEEVDHINGDTYDNRIENLRECTDAQNAQNRKKPKTYAIRASKHKGVCYYKPNGKWAARIKVNNKKIHLGYFEHEHNAAYAYDAAAKHYFGAFARYNNITNFDFTSEHLCENLKRILNSGDAL